MNQPRPRSSATRSKEQGGYVLPMFAIMLTVLMAMAGFGVDVWNWWYNAQRIQRAADAGSLAGVVFLPNDSTAARNTAISVVGTNGFPSAAVSAGVGDRPNRLRVAVTQQVPNNFVSLLGIRSTTITRDATAEFSGPIPLGSPANQMGNQPISGADRRWGGNATDAAATNPGVWTQIAGPGNQKNNGDRFTSNQCAAVGPTNSVYNCSGSNGDRTTGAYLYGVRLDVGPGTNQVAMNESIDVEIYDPAFVQSGDNCTQFDPDAGAGSASDLNAPGGSLNAAQAANRGVTLPNGQQSIRQRLANLDTRYNSLSVANNRTFCTGDHHIGAADSGTARQANYPPVTFTMFGADSTPWTTADNPQITSANCSARTFRPYGQNSNGTANTNETPARLPDEIATSGSYASQVFHRWVRVCRFTVGAGVGVTGSGQWDLFLRANTTTGTGHNRYAIRAGVPTSGGNADGRGISIYAHENMPLYQNAEDATAQFYLTRIPDGADGRELQVQFFDVGDGSGSGTIRIVPPPDYTTSATALTGCRVSREPNGAGLSVTNPGCRLDGVSTSNYQAQRIVMTVPIPNDYECDNSNSTECWWRVEFDWSAAVQDTTTWSASITGDPVRLIE